MKSINGDLIALAMDGTFDVIVHGCNCFNTMGAGIALQVANTFTGPGGPVAVDKDTIPGDYSKLGTINLGRHMRPDGSILTIVNAYTQYGLAVINMQCVVDYKAIRAAFKKIGNSAFAGLKIGYPAIGAGLAGGDWSIISPIIDEELTGMDHTLVVWSGPDKMSTAIPELEF